MKKSELRIRQIIKEILSEQLGTSGGYPINSPNPNMMGKPSVSPIRPSMGTSLPSCPAHVVQAANMLADKQPQQQQAKIFKWIASLFKCKGHGNPGGGAGSGGGDPMNDFEDFIIGADDDDFV